MKRVFLIAIAFVFAIAVFASCATVDTTQTTDVRITIGGQPIEPDSQETTAAAEQSPAGSSANSRAWPNVLLLVLGIPLSLIGILTLFVFAREVRKRKQVFRV